MTPSADAAMQAVVCAETDVAVVALLETIARAVAPIDLVNLDVDVEIVDVADVAAVVVVVVAVAAVTVAVAVAAVVAVVVT